MVKREIYIKGWGKVLILFVFPWLLGWGKIIHDVYGWIF